jgi:hypothetical protein
MYSACNIDGRNVELYQWQDCILKPLEVCSFRNIADGHRQFSSVQILLNSPSSTCCMARVVWIVTSEAHEDSHREACLMFSDLSDHGNGPPRPIHLLR